MFKIKSQLIIILSLMLVTACGGGGGGDSSSSSNQPSTPVTSPDPTDPVITEPSPSPAPNLFLSRTSLVMNESDSTTVELSTSNYSLSELEYSITVNNTNVSTTLTGSELLITSSSVESDASSVITVVATAGESSKTETISVTITNIVLPDEDENEIELTVDDENVSLDGNEEILIAFSATSNSGSPLTTTVSTSIPELIASIEGSFVKIETLDVVEQKEGVVTILSRDEENNEVKTMSIAVVLSPAPIENTPPEITLEGMDESGIVEIFATQENQIQVNVSDLDGDSLTWGLAGEFRIAAEEFDPLTGVISHDFDTTNNLITITLSELTIGGDVLYIAPVYVSDGKTTVNKDFYFRAINPINGSPLIKFSDNVINGKMSMDIGGNDSVSYELLDDAPELVSITSVGVWMGDADKFSYNLDTDSQTINISHLGSDSGDTVYLRVNYTDVSSSGSFFFSVTSRAVWGAWHQEQMEYVYEVRQQLGAAMEYSYIVDFYSDVLENTGVITRLEALDYKFASGIDDTEMSNYYVTLSLLTTLEQYVIMGYYESADDVPAATYSTIEYRLTELLTTKGKTAQNIVNNLALMSQGLLENVDYETTIDLYDSDNKYYSHFTNNDKYGSVVDGKWVFSSEYSFLQAIIEKSRSLVTDVYEP